MEAAAPTKPASKPALGRPSPSFRLHSRSLNALRLRRVFDLFDRNGDGEITVQELSEALGRLGLEADAYELASTVATYIKPGRAGLDFEDFESLHRSLGDALFGDVGCGGDGDAATEENEEESDLTEAFRVFDEDGDGYISAGELQAVLGKLGLPDGGCIGRVREMICSVDRNHDGQVDFREFKHMMGAISVYGS